MIKKSIFQSKMNINPNYRFTLNLIDQICLKIPEVKNIILDYIEKETNLSGINYNINLYIFLYEEEVIFFFHDKEPQFNGHIYFENNETIINLNDIPELKKILKRSIKKERKINTENYKTKEIISISIFENCLIIDPESGYGAEIIEDTSRVNNVKSFLPSQNIHVINLNLKKHWKKLESPVLKLSKYIENHQEKIIIVPDEDLQHTLNNHQRLDQIMEMKKIGISDQNIKDLRFLTNDIAIQDFGRKDIYLKFYMERIGNVISVSAEPYLKNQKLNVYGIRYHIGCCTVQK